MVVLQRIGVLSFAKINGVLMGCFGVLVGLLVAVATSAGDLFRMGQGPFFRLGYLAVIVLPFFYAVMGFLSGAFAAAVYNFVANLVGGVELQFEEAKPRRMSARRR